MVRAFVFPGQGAQAVGMGKELAQAFRDARDVFEEVDEALKQNLMRLMFEGPEDELTLTENAQPALMAMSLAVMRVLARQGNVEVAEACQFVAGHSLGEYSALAAAGGLAVGEAAVLLKRRGLAMQDAVSVGEGAMAALLGLDVDEVGAVVAEAAQGDVCETANDNAPGQVVVSGSRTAVERAVALAGERGARKCVMLPVSAPFHCALMAPAAEVMEDALSDAALQTPLVPLISNVSAEAVSDADAIRRLLVEQVTAMVRWRESVLYMKESGVEELVEIGVGAVLTGLARRIDRDLSRFTVGTPDGIESFLDTLR
ncbi:MAG: ACP S-malonyltransferase [Rhodospirillales bacterium]|nr:ACP S-malonyltransferase [Rhodospirillales bacterium]